MSLPELSNNPDRIGSHSGMTMSRAAPHSDADILHLTRFLTDSVGGSVDVWKAHGDFAVFANGGRPVVFVSGAAHARTVFAHPDALHLSFGLTGPRKSDQRAFTRGVFGINGPHHQFVRKLMLPSFRKPVVEGHHDRIAECVREVIGTWRAGQTRDLYREMKSLSLLMTDRLLFGGGDLDLSRRVDEAFDTWLGLHHRTSFAALLPVESPPDAYDRLLDAASDLGALLRQLIASCRRNAAGSDLVVARLLAAADAGELTEPDVLGLVHSLFNAAHHTVTSALTWTLFLLAQHPEVNADLLDELSGPAVPNRAPLVDRVIKESMRVLPPPVYVCRHATQPVSFGGTGVPAGTVVVLGLYVTHHTPSSFASPERFDPARWLATAPCPHSNVPFGGGARMCLGAPLATQFLETALSLIVPRFRLTVVPDSHIDRRATLTLRPAAGIPVLIRDQDRRFSTSPVTGTIHEMVNLPTATAGAAAA